MTLCVIPSYMSSKPDLKLTLTAIRTLRETAPEAEILVVDDGSPFRDGLDGLRAWQSELEFELIAKPENEGFARTVNVGLRQAVKQGQDAVLVNADVEFFEPWLDKMLATEADVVGGLLLYENGLIQHAGVYYSVFSRQFNHIYRCAPGNLAQAQVERICPVTAALQLIRFSTLQTVGLYDENFQLGWEDMDYCYRVFEAGRVCKYTPHVRAYHYESMFRGRKNPELRARERQSIELLHSKWAGHNFTRHAPTLLID